MTRARRLRWAALATAVVALATEAYACPDGVCVPGSRVEAYSSMAGRWLSGKIVSIDGIRYMFQADDQSVPNGFFGVARDNIRPIGAAAPPPPPNPPPAAAAVPGPGNRVEAYSPMAKRWLPGKIVGVDGARYMFQADDQSLPNGFFGVTKDDIRPIGAAAPPPPPNPPPAVAAVPAPPSPPAPPAPPPAPRPPTAGACGGGSGSVHFAGAQPARLGGGQFPSGEPMGTPGQTNYKMDARGQRSIVAVAPPGQGPFVGLYSLMVGGTWSTASTRDLGRGVIERTLEWNVPAQANVLAINADGTWYRKSGSDSFYGRWIDLGQNVAQLIGYDGDDWTGSMQMAPGGDICRMEMRSPLGQTEWGRRF